MCCRYACHGNLILTQQTTAVHSALEAQSLTVCRGRVLEGEHLQGKNCGCMRCSQQLEGAIEGVLA